MKRLFATAAIAVVLAGPALAAVGPYGPGPGGPGSGRGVQLRARADQLEQRIRRGMADGSLDRREAERAFGELREIRRMEDDLLARGRGFLSPPDRQRIAERLDQLERSIRWLLRNDRVGPGFGGPPQGRPEGPPGGFRYGYGREFWNGAPRELNQRLGWLEMRVRRGIEDGSITRGEADRAFDMLRDFRRMRDDLLARDGGRLSGRSEAQLNQRLDEISQHIRWLRENNRRD